MKSAMINRMATRSSPSHDPAAFRQATSARVARRGRLLPLIEPSAGPYNPPTSYSEALPPATQTGPPGANAAPSRNFLLLTLMYVGVFVLTAAGTFFSLAYFRDRQSSALAPERSTTPEAMPAGNNRLNMRAEPNGDGWILSWDPKNTAIRPVTAGVLQIDDGPQHREMILSGGEIAKRSISYKPVSGNVVFRLQLQGGEDVRQTETLEVVETPAHSRESQAEVAPDTSTTPQMSSAPEVRKDHEWKQIEVPKTTSQSLRGRTGSIAAPATSMRTSRQYPTEARQTAPSLPTSNAQRGQPTVLSQQTPPEPVTAPVGTIQPSKAAAGPAGSVPSAINRPAPSRESGSRDAASSAPPPGQPAPAVQNTNYVPARPLKWAAPDARSLGVSRIPRAADIAIKVGIDDAGRVVSAHALLDGSVHDPAVLAAAAAAVKQWTFEPAKIHGRNVPSEDTIIIHVDAAR